MYRQSHRNSPWSEHAGGNGPTTTLGSADSSAALKGATRAFGTSPKSTKPQPPPSKSHGAWLAATTAGTMQHERATSQYEAQIQEKLSVKEQIRNLEKSTSSPLLVPTSTPNTPRRLSPARSASQIAAQIAAKRSPVSNPSPATNHEPPSSVQYSGGPRHHRSEDKLTPARRRAESVDLPSTIASQPVRNASFESERSPVQDVIKKKQRPGGANIKSHSHSLSVPALEAALGAFARSPSRSPSISMRSDGSRSSSLASRPRVSLDAGPYGHRLSSLNRELEQETPTAENVEFPKGSIAPEPEKDMQRPVPQRARSLSVHENVSPVPRLLDQRTGLTESALADAMVAGSLASSRAPSPHKLHQRPPPPLRPSKPRNLIQRMVDSGESRSASPPKKGMKQTLRKPPKSDDEDEGTLRRGRRHLVRKHHRKHHEGDRKKWRDEVTTPQRKRYEGVWASNKGIFMPPDPIGSAKTTAPDRRSSELVLNLVVQDIWRRSRLPDDVLEEVWDLVARPGVAALGRDEFVVGMWLIDQRLRGRKLPIRVSYSVWASVRHSIGLQVKNRIK